MRRIPDSGIPKDRFTAEPTFVGLDVAANREKGLRCSIRTPLDVWEITLRLKNPVRLASKYPFIDIPLPVDGITTAYVSTTFDVSDETAASISQGLNQAKCIAIDSPSSFAEGERRTSETTWHHHTIPSIKPKKGGIFWTPSATSMHELFSSYFSSADRCELTTEQLTSLGQSLWMLVGFWLHESFRLSSIKTIEVFPAALRVVCQHIEKLGYSNELKQDYEEWGGKIDFASFITSKSETNDAAISCFTAYLWFKNKTEEIHPNEIVVPLNRASPFNSRSGLSDESKGPFSAAPIGSI